MTRSPGLTARTTLFFFAASLALRLVCLAWVVAADVPLLYDELGYFERAVALRRVVLDLVALTGPAAGPVETAYGLGHWPPAHSAVVGLSLALGGAKIWVARLAVVVLSALTTVLIYKLGTRLADERSARAAASFHLVYPTFVAYSHYLWSETTFAFFLIATLLAALHVVDRRGRGSAAALCGALLGLTALTRAAALPLLVLIPLWLLWRLRGRRGAVAGGVALLVSVFAMLPWQVGLSHREGRFVPGTTLAGYNLALGNNPWIEGCGSSWGDERSKRELHAAIARVAREREIDRDRAAALIATREIKARPGQAVKRVFERLLMLWAPDFFPLRHLASATYPPVPPPVAVVLAVGLVTAYLALLGLVLIGAVAAGRARTRFGLLYLVVLAGMLPAVATVGISRFHLPLLVVLLPVAGFGWTRARRRSARIPRWLGLAIGFLAGVLLAATLPCVVARYLQPSSHYRPVLAPAAEFAGLSIEYGDRFELRGAPGEVEVEATGGDFGRVGGGRRLRIRFDGEPAAVDVWSTGDEVRLKLSRDGRSVELGPVSGDQWRRWRPTGLDGVEVRWAGPPGSGP